MNKYQEALETIRGVMSSLPAVGQGEEMGFSEDFDFNHDGYEHECDLIQELVNKETQYNYEYHGRKVKLHGIYQFSVLIETSSLIGGHNGGVAAYPMAVVEFEHGALAEVRPTELKGVRNNESEI